MHTSCQIEQFKHSYNKLEINSSKIFEYWLTIWSNDIKWNKVLDGGLHIVKLAMWSAHASHHSGFYQLSDLGQL